jgi:hypothetical protein
MLQKFQKEQRLQSHIIEQDLANCPRGNLAALQEITERTARAAGGPLFQYRFGAFAGGGMSILYSNMGPPRQCLLKGFREELAQEGVRELALATWPIEGEDKDYTLAILIDCPESMWRKPLPGSRKSWESISLLDNRKQSGKPPNRR